MMSRHAATTAAFTRQSAARRRQRRRASATLLYCATNGCASYLELNPATGVATCPICGYRRRLG